MVRAPAAPTLLRNWRCEYEYEVLFQPSIAGVDQAGIVEIVDDLLRHIPGSSAKPNVMNTDVTSNIFLTGGQAHFKNFDDRLRLELRSILPVGLHYEFEKQTILPWMHGKVWLNGLLLKSFNSRQLRDKSIRRWEVNT